MEERTGSAIQVDSSMIDKVIKDMKRRKDADLSQIITEMLKISDGVG